MTHTSHADLQTNDTLRLKMLTPATRGHSLGLRSGDLLAAINGKAFHGDTGVLARRFRDRPGKPLALTFLRGAEEFTLLVDRPDLGPWEAVSPPREGDTRRRMDPDQLINWEILRARDGSYDLQPLRTSALAQIVPPLWFLEMRLWVPFATFVAAMAAGALVSPLVALLVYGATALHLRQAAAGYVRIDRRARGLVFHAVIAARTEAEAHRVHLRLKPNDHFLFAAPIAHAATETAQSRA
jgi:hypothetical protein